MPEALIGPAVGAGLNALFGDNGASDANAAAAQASQLSGQAALKMANLNEDQYNYWKTNFAPALADLAQKSKDFGSQEEQDRAGGEAHADVASNFATQRGNLTRNLQSYGINPGSGAFADANLKMGLEEAKADALAQNQARKGVRDLAFGKQLDVQAIGKGMPASATAGLASAAANGTAASNSSFLQGQVLGQQARAGYAPIVSAVQQGVKKWFDTPSGPEQLGDPAYR